MSHVGYLRHLLVRKAVKTGEILIDLVTTTQMIEGIDTKRTVIRNGIYDLFPGFRGNGCRNSAYGK